MIDLSIIIPVYNVEKYLDKCLESITKQELENCEVLIINDGSTDNSEVIIDKYISTYEYMKKINKINNGLGAARNTGIEIAKGKYISFIDSDDYIDDNMLKIMLDTIENTNSDMAICDILMFEDSTDKVLGKISLEKHYYNNILSRDKIIKMYLSEKITGHAWNKIYRRSLFIDNNIRYDEGKYYEDMYTTLQLLNSCNKVIAIENIYYNYRQRKGNITSSYSEKHITDYISSIYNCINYIRKINSNGMYKKYLKAFKVCSIQNAMYVYYKYKRYNIRNIRKDYYKYFGNAIYEVSLMDVLTSKIIPNNRKRSFLLWKFGILPYKEKIKNLL